LKEIMAEPKVEYPYKPFAHKARALRHALQTRFPSDNFVIQDAKVMHEAHREDAQAVRDFVDGFNAGYDAAREAR
jgi:hypothetical protein